MDLLAATFVQTVSHIDDAVPTIAPTAPTENKSQTRAPTLSSFIQPLLPLNLKGVQKYDVSMDKGSGKESGKER